MLDVSGQFTACLDLAGGPVSQNAGVEIDVDFPAPEVPANELFGQGILDVALNRPAERPRSIRAVLAGGLDDPVGHFRAERDPQLAIDQVGVEDRKSTRLNSSH